MLPRFLGVVEVRRGAEGRWHVDTAGIRAGDVVFFDWSGSNTMAKIDHVGVVEYVKGNAVHIIEGNTADACRRRVRDRSTIVGYGRPTYDKAAAPAKPTLRRVLKLRTPWIRGTDVRAVQRKVETTADGIFGPLTDRAVKAYQRRHVATEVSSCTACG